MYFNILHISILIFSIATIIFYKLEVKRPFKKLYQSLTRDELIDDNQALSDLFKILYSKTNMELAIFNSKIGRMLYSISFLVAGICPFILKEYVGKIISYFLAGFFYSYLIFTCIQKGYTIVNSSKKYLSKIGWIFF